MQRSHFFIGIAISLLFTAAVAFAGVNLWILQADLVSCLLSFTGVPHSLFVSGNPVLGYSGPTFEMLIAPQGVPTVTVVAATCALLVVIIVMCVFRKIPPPIKTIALVVSIVSILTLLWQAVFPPFNAVGVHWITIDWSCSGLIGLCLISFIFTPLVFTIRGPLWVKVFWLLVTVGFSFAWNLVRMSLVTATLYYFGGSVFLIFHYLIGAFIDFIYIVAFYSLAMVHLSKFDICGVVPLSL